MDKYQIAEILLEMSSLLDLVGENPFKVRAYENAARSIEGITEDIGFLIKENKLIDVKGIGKNISEHIAEIFTKGTFGEYEKLRKTVPAGVMEMFAIPGLGPKRVRFIWQEEKIKTVGELELVCKRHLLADKPGFGEKTEEKILSGIESLKKFAGKRLYPEAYAAALSILKNVKQWPEVRQCSIAGSIRRKKEIIKDIDILVSTQAPIKVMDRFVKLPIIEKVVQHGETKSEVILVNGMQCDLRAVTDDEYPFALHYFTGSKEHNVAMRTLAKKADTKMNEYGLFRGKGDKSIKCDDEAGIFKNFGLAYIEPELREDMGEIEAAAKNELPKLIDEKDVRGVLHCHTTYSDGANSIMEMAKAALDLGYEYISINDHSRSSTIANGLKPEDIKKQHKEIDELNRMLKGFRIIKGIELDILSDGTLDYDDELLSTFEIVIAAVHSRFGMNEQEMTQRIIKALSNPHVDALAHPTGRLLLAREPYAVDLKAVIDAAAKYHKAIEINSHPQRLDLDWRFCKYAKEKGVKLAICTDAHSAAGLTDMVYGVGVARKGWLEKGDVLNTMDAAGLLKVIARSRKIL